MIRLFSRKNLKRWWIVLIAVNWCCSLNQTKKNTQVRFENKDGFYENRMFFSFWRVGAMEFVIYSGVYITLNNTSLSQLFQTNADVRKRFYRITTFMVLRLSVPMCFGRRIWRRAEFPQYLFTILINGVWLLKITISSFELQLIDYAMRERKNILKVRWKYDYRAYSYTFYKSIINYYIS